ncbi:hypothetical protein JZ751_009170 [Albula glossodonta]|uniref:Myb-like domain-containing protein n=1 Tax=Albula glossodonta TaxID=121402 RepID=A0A8T2N8G9_9TELE|nr:hypothetical protein JZ751_009170 [Albula glossodonta]
MAAPRSTRVTRSSVGINGLDENFCGRTLRNRSIAQPEEAPALPVPRARSPKKRQDCPQQQQPAQKGALSGREEQWLSPRKRVLSCSEKDSPDRPDGGERRAGAPPEAPPLVKRAKRCSRPGDTPGDEDDEAIGKAERPTESDEDPPTLKVIPPDDQADGSAEGNDHSPPVDDPHKVANGLDTQCTAGVETCPERAPPSSGDPCAAPEEPITVLPGVRNSNLAPALLNGGQADASSSHPHVPCTNSHPERAEPAERASPPPPVAQPLTPPSAPPPLSTREPEEELDVVGDSGCPPQQRVPESTNGGVCSAQGSPRISGEAEPPPEAGPAPKPARVPAPDPTDAPAPDPDPTDTPVPAPMDAPAHVPTETDAPAPDPTDTPTPVPKDTPAPDPTDVSIPAPDPVDPPAPNSTDGPGEVPSFTEPQEHRYTLRTSPRRPACGGKGSPAKLPSPSPSPLPLPTADNGPLKDTDEQKAEDPSPAGSGHGEMVRVEGAVREGGLSDGGGSVVSASTKEPAAIQAAEEEEDEEEPDVYYFESDHLALKHNKDYQRLLQTISVLEAQRTQAILDLETLARHQREALRDPISFVEKLQKQVGLGLPCPQRVVQLPEIAWDQYTSGLGDFEREFRDKKRNTRRLKLIFDKVGLPTRPKSPLDCRKEGESSALYSSLPSSDTPEHSASSSRTQMIRGRVCDQNKPDTFNQLWTVEEQKRLEQLLLKFPPEEVESKRWQKIADELGNRTAKQVLAQTPSALTPPPPPSASTLTPPTPLSLNPNINPFSPLFSGAVFITWSNCGSVPHLTQNDKRQHHLNKHLYRPSTFLTSYEPPVYMDDEDDRSSFYSGLQDPAAEDSCRARKQHTNKPASTRLGNSMLTNPLVPG